MSRTSRTDDLARMRSANPASAEDLREATSESDLTRSMRRAIAAGESPVRPIPAGDRVAIERGAGGTRGRPGSSRGGASPRSASASPVSR